MKLSWKKILFGLVVILVFVLGYVLNDKLPIATGYAAKNMCSCVFLADRSSEQIQKQDLNFSIVRFTKSKIDHSNQMVTTSLAGLFKRSAVYKNGLGCSLVFPHSPSPLDDFDRLDCRIDAGGEQIPTDSSSYKKELPQQNWNIDQNRLENAVKSAFDSGEIQEKKTRAVVILHQGELIAEHYAEGFDLATPQLGWSMTKSVTNAITGILVMDGLISIDAPAPIAAWKMDGRSAITIKHLLQQNPGLEWEELYGDASDVTEMLYKQQSKSQYAIEKPLVFPVGEKWIYSSGTSNILTHVLMQQFDGLNEYVCFVRQRLFTPLGMTAATMEPDASGEIVGSSYTFATPREWARFGQLYLQDGMWEGNRILPEGWVDFTRQASNGSEGVYGAHFWLNESHFYPSAPTDMFSANGFQGQRIFILPSHDLVIVRLGLSSDFDFDGLLREVLECFQ
jgi:CubicO group peptidase (beta-lactamase class C family)